MELGRKQILVAKRPTSNGMYFIDDVGNEVLLPKGEIDKNLNIGDKKELFIYKDSEDRLIATLKEPNIMLGELARLRVIQVTKIGAFLDWGLAKDLFLPFKEQTDMVVKNKSYLVGLYIDKSNRLCATMKIYKYLKMSPKYRLGTRINATVYSVDRDTGALLALEDKYFGFIPNQEIIGRLEVGDNLDVRVVYKRKDGKYNVSMRRPIFEKRFDDSRELVRLMKEWDGELLVRESDTPEKIRRICSMSKAEFKRAIGKLLKDGIIEKDSEGYIKLIKNRR